MGRDLFHFLKGNPKLISLFIILLITVSVAVELCPVHKIPTEITISHSRHPRNVIVEGKDSLNSINITIKLIAVDPEGGRIGLQGKELLMSINVLERFYDPNTGTLVLTETAFPVNTDENGEVDIDITLPASVNPRKISYQIHANFEGDKNYVGSDKVERYIPGTIPLISLTACFPIVLMAGLLMGAMYATGRNPFGYLDFSRFAFRVPTIKRSRHAIKKRTMNLNIAGALVKKLAIKTVARLPSAALGGAARILSTADRLRKKRKGKDAAATPEAATPEPGKVKRAGKMVAPVKGKGAKDASADIQKKGTAKRTLLGKMAAGLSAMSVGYVKKIGTPLERATYSREKRKKMKEAERRISEGEGTAADRELLRSGREMGFKENVLGVLSELGLWKPRAGKLGFLMNVVGTLGSLVPSTSYIYTASMAHVPHVKTSMSKRRKKSFEKQLEKCNEEMKLRGISEEGLIDISKLKYSKGGLTKKSREEIIRKLNLGLGTTLNMSELSSMGLFSTSAMYKLSERVRFREPKPVKKVEKAPTPSPKVPVKVGINTENLGSTAILSQLISHLDSLVTRNAQLPTLSPSKRKKLKKELEKDKIAVGQSIAIFLKGKYGAATRENLDNELMIAHEDLQAAQKWTIEQAYADIVKLGLADHRAGPDASFEEKLKAAKSMFRISAIMGGDLEKLKKQLKTLKVGFTDRMTMRADKRPADRAWQKGTLESILLKIEYIEKPVKLQVVVTPKEQPVPTPEEVSTPEMNNPLLDALKMMQIEQSYLQLQGKLPPSMLIKLAKGANVVGDAQIEESLRKQASQFYGDYLPALTDEDWKKMAAGQWAEVRSEKMKEINANTTRSEAERALDISDLGNFFGNMSEARKDFLAKNVYANEVAGYMVPLYGSFKQDLFDHTRASVISNSIAATLSEEDRALLSPGTIYGIAAGSGACQLRVANEQLTVLTQLQKEIKKAGGDTEAITRDVNAAQERVTLIRKIINDQPELGELPTNPSGQFALKKDEVQGLLTAGWQEQTGYVESFKQQKTEGMSEPEKELMNTFIDNVVHQGTIIETFDDGLRGTLSPNVLEYSQEIITNSSEDLLRKNNYETLLRALKGGAKELGPKKYLPQNFVPNAVEKFKVRRRIKELNKDLREHNQQIMAGDHDTYSGAISHLNRLTSGQSMYSAKVTPQEREQLDTLFFKGWGINSQSLEQVGNAVKSKKALSLSTQQAEQFREYVTNSIIERGRVAPLATIHELAVDRKKGTIVRAPYSSRGEKKIRAAVGRAFSGEGTAADWAVINKNLPLGVDHTDFGKLGKGKAPTLSTRMAQFVVDSTKSRLQKQNPIADMRSNPNWDDLQKTRQKMKFASYDTRQTFSRAKAKYVSGFTRTMKLTEEQKKRAKEIYSQLDSEIKAINSRKSELIKATQWKPKKKK